MLIILFFLPLFLYIFLFIIFILEYIILDNLSRLFFSFPNKKLGDILPAINYFLFLILLYLSMFCSLDKKSYALLTSWNLAVASAALFISG